MIKNILKYSACSVLAALPLGPACAQTAASQPAAPSPTSLEEVVVTAQRFTESAQKASVVISVIGADELKGITDVRQLQTVEPGIQLGVAGSVTQTFVRGVGSPAAVNSQESSIAFNVDGVFLFTSSMISPLMYDLERIEVLKGPQGTLYGRNASGGAVNLITTGASLDGVNGYVEGEVGNYDLRRVVGAVNVPLSSTLAVRLAGQHVEHSGYLSDDTDDQDVTSGRVRVLWKPSDTVSLQLGLDGSKSRGKGAGSSVNPNPTGDDFVGALDPRLNTGPFFLGGTSLQSAPPNPPPYYRNDQWSAHAQLDVDLGFATLTVLPAYRDEKADYLDYVPGFQDKQKPHSKQKSIEVRLGNRNETLKWVVGGYYFDLEQTAIQGIRNESSFQDAAVDFGMTVESYAFFGEATYSLTDQLRVIGGLRYSDEKTNSEGSVNAALGFPGLGQTPAYNPFDPVTNPTGEVLDYPFNNKSAADAVTWRAGLEFDVTPDSMLFFTASRGFKGGGTYIDVPGVDSSFDPEYLTAFELGSRNRFLNNTLQVNGELFYWKLKDQQIPYVGFNSIGQVTLITANAGEAHMYGADLDVVWRATPDDTFQVGVEYLKAEYDSFTRIIPSAVINTTTRCQVIGYAGPASLAPAVVDCGGQQALRSPEWSGTASYEHRFDLQSAGELLLNLNMTFASSRYLTPTYAPFFRQGWNTLYNASLTYTAPNEAISVSGWIRNIGDERVMSSGEQFNDFYSRPTLQPPRTFGLSARYAF